MPPIITLTTDFGLRDEYVGVMKGVILTKAPAARLIDLSHEVEAFDIRGAAYLIAASYPYFASGTIHLIVVDPGVGSSRHIIGLQAGGQVFLAPDNGVLSIVASENPEAPAFILSTSKLTSSRKSSTFHGRDIFAPLAASLANGASLAELGREVPLEELNHFAIGQPRWLAAENNILASILHIDSFGNAVSNISNDFVDSLGLGHIPAVFSLILKGCRSVSLCRTYGDVAPGELLLLFNSRGYLEIAVNQGNAAELLGIKSDDRLVLGPSAEIRH